MGLSTVHFQIHQDKTPLAPQVIQMINIRSNSLSTKLRPAHHSIISHFEDNFSGAVAVFQYVARAQGISPI